MFTPYIDLSQYDEGRSDNKMGKAVIEAEVEGKLLKLGMSYDEVLSAGFYAPEGFVDEEAYENLSTSTSFKTKDGKKVELGFLGLNDGDKVADGLLCGIQRYHFWKENPAVVTIEGISAGTDLETVVKTFGEPATMHLYDHCIRMRYEFNDDSAMGSITVDINSEGTVEGLDLQGRLK